MARIKYENIENSNITFSYENLTFYFSSLFYKDKFMKGYKSYIKECTKMVSIRYNINIEMDMPFLVSYYRQIEKKGFKIECDEKRLDVHSMFICDKIYI